jgi:hypothetical protein
VQMRMICACWSRQNLALACWGAVGLIALRGPVQKRSSHQIRGVIATLSCAAKTNPMLS